MTDEQEVKTCVTCRHCDIQHEAAYETHSVAWFIPIRKKVGERTRYICREAGTPPYESVDMVTGEVRMLPGVTIECEIERRFGDCGKEAIYWAPQDA